MTIAAYRMTVEDAPAEADVEVLPHAFRPIHQLPGRSAILRNLTAG